MKIKIEIDDRTGLPATSITPKQPTVSVKISNMQTRADFAYASSIMHKSRFMLPGSTAEYEEVCFGIESDLGEMYVGMDFNESTRQSVSDHLKQVVVEGLRSSTIFSDLTADR